MIVVPCSSCNKSTIVKAKNSYGMGSGIDEFTCVKCTDNRNLIGIIDTEIKSFRDVTYPEDYNDGYSDGYKAALLWVKSVIAK